MSTLLQDLRFALRTFAQAPGFTAVALVVLALGIGANTAMFTLVNAMLFKPLAGHRPDELVGLFSHDRTKPDLLPRLLVPQLRRHPRQPATSSTALMAHTLRDGGRARRRHDAAHVRRGRVLELLRHARRAARRRPPVHAPTKSARRATCRSSSSATTAGATPASIRRSSAARSRSTRPTSPSSASRRESFTGTMALCRRRCGCRSACSTSSSTTCSRTTGTGLADRANNTLIVVAGRLKPGCRCDGRGAAARRRRRGSSRRRTRPRTRTSCCTVSPLPRMSTSTSPQTDAGIAVAGRRC